MVDFVLPQGSHSILVQTWPCDVQPPSLPREAGSGGTARDEAAALQVKWSEHEWFSRHISCLPTQPPAGVKPR